MNKEVITRWTEKLRSGEYIQGRNQLRDSEREEVQFCCLGVLCDMYREMTGDGEWLAEDDAFFSGEETNENIPPEVVLDWAGIDDNYAQGLATKNDEGWRFTDIAYVIESDFKIRST